MPCTSDDRGVYTQKGNGALGRIPASPLISDRLLTNGTLFHGVKTCRVPTLTEAKPGVYQLKSS